MNNDKKTNLLSVIRIKALSSKWMSHANMKTVKGHVGYKLPTVA